MAKIIDQVEFSNFLIKAVLGKGHDSLAGKKTLESLQNYYAGDNGQIETVVEILSGENSESSVYREIFIGIQNLNIIIQEFNSEEFRCCPDMKTIYWAFISNVFAPQLACLYTSVNYLVTSTSPLYYVEHFLNGMIEGETPSSIAKKTLQKYNHNQIDINQELNSIKKDSALTNRTINNIVKLIEEELKSKKNDSTFVFGMSVHEIKSFLMCSRYFQLIHNSICKIYSNNCNVVDIYKYFNQCVLYSKMTSEHEEFINSISLYPRMFIHWHKKLYNMLKISYDKPAIYESISGHGVYRAIRDSMRDYLFKQEKEEIFSMDLIHPTQSVIGSIFIPFVGGQKWNRSEYPNTKAANILSNIRENLCLEDYRELLSKLKCEQDFECHIHEFYYHSAIVDIRCGDGESALENLHRSIEMCKNRMAGKTVVKSAKLIIMIKLLINKKLNGGWYQKYLHIINLHMPNEVIFSIGNEVISNKEISFFKLANIVSEFNRLNLIDNNGVDIKFDPMSLFYEITRKIHENFDGDISRSIVETVKSHNLSRPISMPIPFTYEMALTNFFHLKKIYSIDCTPKEVNWLIEKSMSHDVKAILQSRRTTKQENEHCAFSSNVDIQKIACLNVR